MKGLKSTHFKENTLIWITTVHVFAIDGPSERVCNPKNDICI